MLNYQVYDKGNVLEGIAKEMTEGNGGCGNLRSKKDLAAWQSQKSEIALFHVQCGMVPYTI